MENLIISSSPHFHSKTRTKNIMLDVIIALIPAAIAAIILYGMRAALIIAVCVATSVASEFFFNLICKKKQTVGDLSAIVTGLLLALSVSTKVSLWHCIVGSVFAIVIVKCVFGGIGCNFANPAVTARVFLLIAFGKVAGGVATNFQAPDLVASATPLEVIKSGEGILPTLTDMLIGNRGGAIGESCAIALILGFIYLLVRRVISWHTPIIYIATAFALSLAIKQDITVALYQVLGGGLLLGAIFMATDYSTTPSNNWGKVIFGFACGIITVLIRLWGYYPEGVSFAILFMNILSPYIEKLCTPKPLGLGGGKNA